MDIVGAIEHALSIVTGVLGIGRSAGDVKQSRDTRSAEERERETLLRLLYGEVLFNVMALRIGAQIMPPILLTADDVYRGLLSSGRLSATDLTTDELMLVAAPYTIVHLMRFQFTQEAVPLMALRLRGHDYDALESLGKMFREAEAMLRPVTWPEERQEQMAEAIEEALQPIAKPGVARRALNTAQGLLQPMIVVAAAWTMYRVAQAHRRTS